MSIKLITISIFLLSFFKKQKFRYWALLITSLSFYTLLIEEKVLILLAFGGWIFFAGKWIEKNRKSIKLLFISIFIGLLPLLFFKYYAVLSYKTTDTLYFVGLSFFTFNGISYLIDIRRKYIKAEQNFLFFLTYLSFLPQLLSGPLHRYKYLSKQIRESLSISDANFSTGFRLILWGVFKNYVLAQRLKILVDTIIDNPSVYTGWYVWFGGFLFFFQIYCDFSSYVDIAQGMAQIFGIKLKNNFDDRVYAKTSRIKFWTGWHITLNHWFRDYFFFPLAKGVKKRYKINLLILVTFTLIGVWHGATMSFLLWGFLNGIWAITERTFQPYFLFIPEKIRNYLGILYHWFIASWVAVIFRTNDLQASFYSFLLTTENKGSNEDSQTIIKYLLIVVPLFFLMDWTYRRVKNKRIDIFLGKQNIYLRWFFYIILALSIFTFGLSTGGNHYYFKF